MDANLKKKWLDALRSGEYEQGSDQLVMTFMDGQDKFCCLGVLADIMGDVEREGDWFKFPTEGLDMDSILWDDEECRLMGVGDWSGDNAEFIRDEKIVAETMIPSPIADKLGLRTLVQSDTDNVTPKKELRNELAHMNDQQGKSFIEIADHLESIDF